MAAPPGAASITKTYSYSATPRGSCHPFNLSYDCYDQSANDNVSISEWTLRWLRKCPNLAHLSREMIGAAIIKKFMPKYNIPCLENYCYPCSRGNAELGGLKMSKDNQSGLKSSGLPCTTGKEGLLCGKAHCPDFG
uniref:Uncharacterized protein n=1 Tax=Romanomermis culicivorax TaxID=13658 RepID=A0A915JEF4_ROMCU